jgi:hypothetical protein
MTNTTPILAIDIDGPLNPRAHNKAEIKNVLARGFRSVPWRNQVSYVPGSTWIPYSNLFLSPKHGGMLRAFSIEHDVELVWASLWEHNANTIVSPALGLPRLPWVDFHGHRAGSKLWKFPAMQSFAAGRPLAWLDDSFTHHARKRAASGFDNSRRNLPTLLHEVDPYVGIQMHDLEAVAAWLKTARLAWDMTVTYEIRQPKPVACLPSTKYRSTRKRFAYAGTTFGRMTDEEFADAIGLDGSPPF